MASMLEKQRKPVVGAPPAPQIYDDLSLDLMEAQPIMFLIRWRSVTAINQPTQRADDDWVCHANIAMLHQALHEGASTHDFQTKEFFLVSERFDFSNLPAETNAIVECWEESVKPLKPCWQVHAAAEHKVGNGFHWHRDSECTEHAFYFAKIATPTGMATLLGRIPMKTP